MVDPSSPNRISIPKDRHTPPLPWWKYLPLMILCVAVVLAAGAGWYVTWRVSQDPTTGAWTPPTSPASSSGIAAMDECRTVDDIPVDSPWFGDSADASEAEFQEHMAAAGNVPYVEGQDGFVFWGDVQANNFSQALGRRTLSDEEVAAWADAITSLETGLAERDIPFLFMVAPAKWSVYADELPEWSQPLRGVTPFDQLLVSYPDLPIVDVRGALRDAAEDEMVFSTVNSHWSDYGSLVAWNQTAACLDALYPEFGPTPTLASTEVERSSTNEFEDFGIETPAVGDWVTPIYSDPLLDFLYQGPDGTEVTAAGGTYVDLLGLPATTDTPGAPSDATVLILRDSFGTMMSVQWVQAFGTTVQVRHNIDYGMDERPDIAALVEEHDPDLVIYELAERHLNWTPFTVQW